MKTILLSVGISQYKSDKIKDLSVCHKDAQAVAAAFAKIAGDSLEQRLLIDKQATKQGIQDGIAWLAETAQKGDLAIFYYSGHGASNPDADGDEEGDQRDEFLCPHDCGVEPGLASFIRDDELREWLKAVGKKTDRVAIVLDSCHSGTAAMAPQRAIAKEVAPGVVRALIGGDRAPKRKAAKDSTVKGLVLLAGCQDNEQSFILSGAENSAFTANILAALDDPSIDTFQKLYIQVSEQTADQVEQLNLQQNPNIVDGTGGALAFRYSRER
jgi:uncharacterized caspase-like protein